MKKSIFIVMLILAVASFSFAQKGSLIGIAMPETHVQRWVKDGNKLKEEAQKKGYKAEVQWGNADQNQQNQQIQSFLNQGAKALIVGCINDGVRSQITAANRDGVQVIAYDRIIPNSGGYDYFITFNNYKVGTLQGQAIEKALNLKAATAASPKYITLFAGSATDGNAFFFFDGAYDVLKPYIASGALKVVGPNPNGSGDRANFNRIATENWMPDRAKARMEGLLNNDARSVTLDAVLSPNDTLARAIIEALKADAKYKGKQLPIVTGQDAEFASVMSIKNGEQHMTVFKDTNQLAAAAITMADQILNKKPVSLKGAVLASGALAEIGNTGVRYVQTYLLDPVLITKDNVAVPANAGFYTDTEAAQIKAK